MRKTLGAIIFAFGVILAFFTFVLASNDKNMPNLQKREHIYTSSENSDKINKDSLISLNNNNFWPSDRISLTKGITSKDITEIDSIINLINQDSIISYVETMQAFPSRAPSQPSADESRQWAYNKFIEFGYDSVIIDSCECSANNVFQNIIAYKIGNEYPEYQIIISAHIDVDYTYSPGADDNASGSAGVLEIARILKDIETSVTFIFIIFDGTYFSNLDGGSWCYAEDAFNNGDSIIAQFDMDMIGYYGNTNDIYLLYDDYFLYGIAAGVLGDLPELNLYDIGFFGYFYFSNYIAFHDYGYSYLAFREYLQNPYVNTEQDSTSYIDFSYATRIVKACVAIATYFDAIFPFPYLDFSYPEGHPDVLTPGIPDTFKVQVDGLYGGVYIPETALLGYSVDWGDWLEEPLTHLGDGLFEAVFPTFYCNTPYIRYAVAVEEATVGYIYEPGGSEPFSAAVGTNKVIAFEDDFETDKGWVGEGMWERSEPTGGSCYIYQCPTYAYSGSYIYGYNIDGCYDVQMGETNLVSPPIDCSGLSYVQIKFWRWLSVLDDYDGIDYATIWVSLNNVSWELVWMSWLILDTNWVEKAVDISQIADNQPEVYIRFTMGPAEIPFSACGWNIDDVVVEGYECNLWDLEILTDTLASWTATRPYYQQLEAYGGAGSFGWQDKYNDLEGTGLTLSSDGAVSGVVIDPQYIIFTAVVSDETKTTKEKEYTFIINDTLQILVDSLPDGILDEWYIKFIQVIGGTGYPPTGYPKYKDKYGDLEGTGLHMSQQWSWPPEHGSGGYVNGFPEIPGEITFTFLTYDMADDSAEREYTFNILSGDIICGDADRNEAINILDITFLINYLYKGGPEPEISWAADCNGDGFINILDITYLIAYLYKNGPEPVCS